jgi:peroxiredoxin
MKAYSALLSVTCALVFAAPAAVAQHTDIQPAATRKAAPDFMLQDSTRTSIRLSDFKGRVVVLDFWATWCQPCKIEIPWYTEFLKKYEAGLVVIGVSLDDDGWKSVRPFIKKYKVDYPIVMGDASIAKQFINAEFLPTTLLIDRTGKIAVNNIGIIDKEVFEKEIRTLLDETMSTNGN